MNSTASIASGMGLKGDEAGLQVGVAGVLCPELQPNKITDDEVKDLAEKEAEKIGIPVDKLINYYKTSNHSERILDQKLFDFLKSNNTINKVHPDKLKVKQEATNE